MAASLPEGSAPASKSCQRIRVRVRARVGIKVSVRAGVRGLVEGFGFGGSVEGVSRGC